MRNITNDYRESQVLDLGTAEQRGPFLVTQTGVNPAETIPKSKMFVLRPDAAAFQSACLDRYKPA